MGSLLVLRRRIATLFIMKWENKRVLIEAFFLTALVRIMILLIPLKKYQKYLGIYAQETTYEINIDEYRTIKRISWAVNLVCRYTPWKSKCLVQAITAQNMLRSRNLSSTLYLGVSKDKNNSMRAHAWLRSGKVLVTGANNISEFKEVAKFAIRVV